MTLFQTLDLFIGLLGVLAVIIAAGLWSYASMIKITGLTDKITDELQRISRWNAYAASAAGVAAVCAAYVFARSLDITL